MKSWFLKNTAYKSEVTYLFKRGTLRKHVSSFYIFFFPDACGVTKEVLDDILKVTTSLTWKVNKYGYCHGTCYKSLPQAWR